MLLILGLTYSNNIICDNSAVEPKVTRTDYFYFRPLLRLEVYYQSNVKETFDIFISNFTDCLFKKSEQMFDCQINFQKKLKFWVTDLSK